MFEMCLSRDSESEIILYVPFMCCEYKAESCSINFVANHLATLSCIGLDAEKLAEWSQPRALDLSVKASSLCGVSEIDNVR